MIKCDNENLEVEGTMVDLLAEYSAITKKLKELFPEDAEKTLREAFRIGMLSKEELHEEFKNALFDLLDRLSGKDEKQC